MNKFPLNFAFEGAFLRAWHITKKNYLGYKIPPITCEIDDKDNLTILSFIDKTINLSDFDEKTERI